MSYIQNVVESDESFRIRRILWAAKQLIENEEKVTKVKLFELASIHNQFRHTDSINKAIDEALNMIQREREKRRK